MKTAIIGCGYRIRDRLSLDIAPECQPDEPPLPVEVARFALPPRLLPVLVDDASLQPRIGDARSNAVGAGDGR